MKLKRKRGRAVLKTIIRQRMVSMKGKRMRKQKSRRSKKEKMSWLFWWIRER